MIENIDLQVAGFIKSSQRVYWADCSGEYTKQAARDSIHYMRYMPKGTLSLLAGVVSFYKQSTICFNPDPISSTVAGSSKCGM